ncbi:MAG: hypothetical protein ACRDOE_11815, partial [Streptosporangiaceae bacterium]
MFDTSEPHESLAVRAQATVETGQALGDPPSVLTWEDLPAQAGSGRLLEFLAEPSAFNIPRTSLPRYGSCIHPSIHPSPSYDHLMA